MLKMSEDSGDHKTSPLPCLEGHPSSKRLGSSDARYIIPVVTAGVTLACAFASLRAGASGDVDVSRARLEASFEPDSSRSGASPFHVPVAVEW